MGGFCSKRKRSSSTKQVLAIDKDILSNATQYSYKELEIATRNFNIQNKIGKGGFGSVYSGRLNDGTLVAIKVLSAQSKQGEPEFLKEIDMLSGLDHVNVVKLYGSCTEGGYKMLVYEYLENNSLAQTLFGLHCNKREFSWKIRSQICIGVAQGIAFLHEEVRPHIVHRDIKSSNVLLDKDYISKISDLGLARIFPNSITHVNTGVVGTPGYIAPEYGLTGTLSRKSDVYSFGILLLEIVSGRRNGDTEFPADEQNILAWAWKLYERGKLDELVDEELAVDLCTNDAQKYLKIGLLCAQEWPKKRPTMSDAVKMLKGEIDVDRMKVPKPGILMALLELTSSSCGPHAPWLGHFYGI